MAKSKDKKKKRKLLLPEYTKNSFQSLTPRQRAYGRYRYRGHEPEQAYRMAGYNGNGNHQAYLRRLERMPKIRVYIQHLFDKNVKEMPDGLNYWERRFVDEYLIDFDKIRAVKDSGIPTMNPARYGRFLLTKAKIIEAIEKREKERSLRTLITSDRILQLLWMWANFDIRKLYDDDGSLKEIQDLDSNSARTIKKIKQFTGSTYWKRTKNKKNQRKRKRNIIEYAIEERRSAAELIGRHLEMFTDKIKTDFEGKIAGVLVTPGMVGVDNWMKAAKTWQNGAPKLMPKGFSGAIE